MCLVSSQPPGGIPGSQPLLPNSLDPTRPQGRPEQLLLVTIKYVAVANDYFLFSD